MYFVCFCVYYIKIEKYNTKKTTHVFYVFLCFSLGDFDWCMCFVCFCVLPKVKTKEGHVFCVFLCFSLSWEQCVMHVFCVFLCFFKQFFLLGLSFTCFCVFFFAKKKKGFPEKKLISRRRRKWISQENLGKPHVRILGV